MFQLTLLSTLLTLYSIHHTSNGAVLIEPETITMKDQGTYHLRAEYCLFTVFDDEAKLVINMTTRCFCYKSDCKVPGPSFIVNAGITVNVILTNNMVGAKHNLSMMNQYKDLDVTNLHTHGLHIDPAVDDMFIALDPREPGKTGKQHLNAHKYAYEILPKHASGTHWYHGHWHGCVALALSGGQFGALIVENEAIDQQTPGLLDMSSNILILHSIWILNKTQCNCDNLPVNYQYIMRGFFMLFSHCSLYCYQPKYQRDKSGIKYDIHSDEIYNNKHVYFVNGQFMPIINDIELHEWRRLRLINADIQQFMQIDFRFNEFAENICNNTCNLRIMAFDGIYVRDISRNLCAYPYHGQLLIPPGGRADVAIQCNTTQVIHIKSSQDNLYDYLSNYTRADHGVILFKLQIISVDTLQSIKKNRNIYPNTSPQKPYYLESLIDGESQQTEKYPVYKECDCTFYNRSLWTMPMQMSKDMHNNKMAGMRNNELKILPFCSAYKDKKGKINGCNKCGFYFLGMPWTNINFRRFSLTQPLLSILANSIYEFKVSAKGPHPMHNHVNPFQLMENINNEGFIAMKGDWRDTLGFAGTYTVRIITLDFVGRNIMHCHTLTHEDSGMMAWYEIFQNKTEKNKFCRMDEFRSEAIVIENNNKEHPVVKWCKNNKVHCGAGVATGLAIAFL